METGSYKGEDSKEIVLYDLKFLKMFKRDPITKVMYIEIPGYKPKFSIEKLRMKKHKKQAE